MYQKYFKRLFDLLVSTIAILLLSPVILIVALLVRLKIGSPIFYKQNRPGLNEKIFTIYKFRTMTNKKDKDGNYLPDELRLTKFGSFLRSTSLDELPELVNIIKGDMSIVGPRPLLEQYIPLYNTYQKRRHNVKPGLTGYAQVNGRNSISWNEKFVYDNYYIDHITFLGDISIILLTIAKVIKKDGINSETVATAEIFQGNDEEYKIDNIPKGV